VVRQWPAEFRRDSTAFLNSSLIRASTVAFFWAASFSSELWIGDCGPRVYFGPVAMENKFVEALAEIVVEGWASVGLAVHGHL